VDRQKLLTPNNLEDWEVLMGGQSIGAIKGSEVPINIAEEVSFLADRSTQLKNRLASWRSKREFGMSLTLYNWDFAILAALLDLTVSSEKLRDKIQSKMTEHAIVFKTANALDFETEVTAETITFTGVGETPFTEFTFEVAKDYIVPGTLAFTLTEITPGETYTDDGYGRLTGSLGGTGYINYADGKGGVTVAVAIAAVTCTDGAYTYYYSKQAEVRFPRATVSLGGDTSFNAEAEGTGLPVVFYALIGPNDYSMEIEFVTPS